MNTSHNNDTEDNSALTLWKAHKTVIRGRLIHQATDFKTEHKRLFAKLEANFNTCHFVYQSTPNAITNTKLDKARHELDLFLTTADKLLHKRQHTQYLKANKPDTPMACSLRTIHQPQTSIFDKTKADTLFSDIKLPTMEPDQQEFLESPITALKVQIAIKALKPHKRPGRDGFSALYYKKFPSILTPILTGAFNSLLAAHSFRTETLTSIISMLPKPKSDSTSWTNYRPMSLLNLDIKLLAKILENKLSNIIGKLIHRDQTGFMPMRQVGDNVRRALLLTHAAKIRRIPTCLLSLDIRKAFNSVTWPYMQYILQK